MQCCSADITTGTVLTVLSAHRVCVLWNSSYTCIQLICAFCLSAHTSPCSTPSLLPRLRAQTAAAGHRIQEWDCHHVRELHLISILLYTLYWPNAIANFSQCRLSQQDMKRQLTHPEGEEVLKMAFGGEKVCLWSAVPDCKKSCYCNVCAGATGDTVFQWCDVHVDLHGHTPQDRM